MLKKHKNKYKQVSYNEIKIQNDWKNNQIRWFKYNVQITNTIEVEVECLRRFKKDFDKHAVKLFKSNQILKNVKLEKRINKSNSRITKFTNVLHHNLLDGTDVRQLCKKYEISKSLFYNLLKIYKDYKKLKFFNFDRLILKDTKPKKSNYKYSNKQVNIMRERYFNYSYAEFVVHASIMQVLFELKYEYPTDEFKTLSYRTLYNKLKADERYSNKEYKPRKYHESRKKYIPVGYVQFDLKIIGPKETHFNKRLIFATLKDEGSKLIYGEFIPLGTAENAVKVLLNGINFFKELKIEIKRIRTDNAMMFIKKNNKVSNFKKINFIHDNSFHELLKKHHIDHEKIPLGQSEANGTIEAYHRTLDRELLVKIDQCKTFEEIAELYANYIEWYNFQRYHTNSIYNYDKRIPKYLKPIDFIKYLNELEEMNLL